MDRFSFGQRPTLQRRDRNWNGLLHFGQAPTGESVTRNVVMRQVTNLCSAPSPELRNHFRNESQDGLIKILRIRSPHRDWSLLRVTKEIALTNNNGTVSLHSLHYRKETPRGWP